jgi:hypothetical protein
MGEPRESGERAPDDEWPRVYDGRDGDDRDPRDGLMHDLDLPRAEERELVVDRDRVYELNGEAMRRASMTTSIAVPLPNRTGWRATTSRFRFCLCCSRSRLTS